MKKRASSSVASLSVFSLVMITAGSVDSVRNLPATALFGSELIFFFIFGALFFLIPTALISAELSSTWPKQGGIYVWVKLAMGEKMGLLAIWLQWIENVIWYPTILSFVAGTLGYLINPALTEQKSFLISVILIAFWSTTWINLRGIQSSARFSNICGIFGLLLPMTLIITLGAMWVSADLPLQISLSPQAILPNIHDSNLWVSLTAIMLSFCGMEIATVHAQDVKDPQRSFPRALLWSSLIIISTLVFGALSIAIVLPKAHISLVAGLMQAFAAFFSAYHISWILPLVAGTLILGGLGSVSNWIIAPTKGLLVAAQDGLLPPSLRQENQAGAPVRLLLAQAVIVTLLTSVFLFMPSINSSYWLLTALAAILYMVMYFMMFITAIILRRRYPQQTTLFKIPGGLKGLIFVASLGFIGTITTIIVSFMPPRHMQIGSFWHYETYLLLGVIVMCLPPFITYRMKQNNWLYSGTKATIEGEL